MHFTINNRKVSPFTINKLYVRILQLFEVKNCTPEINEQLFEAQKRSLSSLQMRLRTAGMQLNESQDIASEDEDNKKICNARAVANRKRKQNEREQ